MVTQWWCQHEVPFSQFHYWGAQQLVKRRCSLEFHNLRCHLSVPWPMGYTPGPCRISNIHALFHLEICIYHRVCSSCQQPWNWLYFLASTSTFHRCCRYQYHRKNRTSRSKVDCSLLRGRNHLPSQCLRSCTISLQSSREVFVTWAIYSRRHHRLRW